jgi:hypothetical protein
MSKHRKPSRHRTPALWVGGFLLLGAVGALLVGIAVSSSADPLDRPAVVPGGLAPADFAERVSVAQVTSRDQDRLDRYQERLRQERIEERRAERREARREARQEERRERRAASRAEQAEATTSVSTSGGGASNTTADGLPPLLQTIRSHESGGNYSAYNAGGCEGYGCGGAYQLHAAYASEWAARAGYPGLSGQAQTWAPATQDAVALHLFYSTNPDGAHWCNWTDYC